MTVQTPPPPPDAAAMSAADAAPAAWAGAGPAPHPLHAADRHWPETNCYLDLWIELLHARGLDPHGILGAAAALLYEGDQFTFSKPQPEDLERLYGLSVAELSLYDAPERHAMTQVALGHVLLIEVDGFFLPDTRATSYRRQHTKTTIALHAIDPARRHAAYFHNAVHAVLEGEDYDGLWAAADVALPPYAERVRPRGAALSPAALRAAAAELLRRDLARRPAGNPVAEWRADVPAQMAALTGEGGHLLHGYAFNLPRQLGATFELLGSQLAWLDPGRFEAERRGCEAVAADSKALQFRIVRAASRRRPDPCDALLDGLEDSVGRVLGGLRAGLG